MGKYLDLTGQRFGMLTAIQRVGTRNKAVLWETQCDCGKVHNTTSTSLRAGKVKSCGCSSHRLALETARKKGMLGKNEQGKRYGRLLVLKQDNKRASCGLLKWICKCNCGNIVSVQGAHLRRGETKSCGCYKGDVHALPDGQAAFNLIFRRYKKGARKRGLEFCLTRDQFATLTKGNCFYCGQKPMHEFGNEFLRGSYIYNGVDRVDNEKGYHAENCVSCCETCNRAKRTMTLVEFKSWIERIHAFLIGGR